MRGGMVARIRVSPQDCMAVADVMQLLSINPSGMSVSGAVSLALSVALEELRKDGKIPRRQGYEYAEMVAPFKVGALKEKRAKTNSLYNHAVNGDRMTLEGVVSGEQEELVQKGLPAGYASWTLEQKLLYQESLSGVV